MSEPRLSPKGFPLCAAPRKDGSHCPTIAVDNGMCEHHAKIAANPPAPPTVIDITDLEDVDDDDPEPVATIGLRPGQVRPKLAEDLAASYDQLVKFNLAAAMATRPKRVSCECGRKFDVQIEDWAARQAALRFFTEQGLGKDQRDDDKLAAEAALIVKDVRDMSDLELAALLAGTTPPPEAA